jgi:UDP-N-acetylmuramyl pentapeptide phosphotransferase/UDP-N-acetylglucosamine-1-phosphate transferase
MLKFKIFSFFFTAFAISGVANSINIIDGFNGIASLTAIYAFFGFALIALQVGDTQLATLCIVLAACVFGFFCVNWPWGKVFLGDGGSYFIGFALAWVAVLVIGRNSEVSPFAALLVCIYPVIEMLFSIYRRKKKKKSPSSPDRLHLHSIIKRRFLTRWIVIIPDQFSNSFTGIVMSFVTLTSAFLANLTFRSTFLSLVGISVILFSYLILYNRLIRFRWRSP